MSSSQPFQPSSPLTAEGGTLRRKSRFTFKHLAQLALSTTNCPLRVIAHVDLDAFYAQCEMVRLNVAVDQPLAVQQWYVTIPSLLYQ
jgi:DNA polymerase eta